MMKFIREFIRLFAFATGYPAKWFFFKTKVYLENERAEKRVKGGALIVSNHFNPMDYIVNCFHFFPRKLCVVASEDGFSNWFFRFFIKCGGGIQANRITKNMRFVVESIRELRAGNLVQIFPEAHNTPDGKIHDFYPSYILIALRANVPIVLIVTDGNYGLFRRVHIMISEKIDLRQYVDTPRPSKEQIQQLNAIVHKRVLDLRQELDARVKGEKRA